MSARDNPYKGRTCTPRNTDEMKYISHFTGQTWAPRIGAPGFDANPLIFAAFNDGGDVSHPKDADHLNGYDMANVSQQVIDAVSDYVAWEHDNAAARHQDHKDHKAAMKGGK